jgi:hypothetical protein
MDDLRAASEGAETPELSGLESLTRSRLRRSSWLALALYSVFAVVMTWPLVLHLADRFPGENTVDAWGHYWNMWWFRRVLLTGENPFFTQLWFAPDGVSLFLHTLAPFNSLLGLAPTLLAGPLVAYNLVALAAIALSAQGMYLLVRHLTGHTGAAFVAGLALGGSPYLMGHLTVGHLNVAALVSLPLITLGLVLASEGRWVGIALTGGALLVSALTEWHTTLFALMIGGLLVLWYALRAGRDVGRWRNVAGMVAGLVCGLILVSPLALATARAVQATGERAELGERWAAQHSANLLAYLVPQDQHPVWGDALLAWRKASVIEVLSEGRVSLGLAVLALALVGLIAVRWRALPWLAMAVVGVALAVGPEIHVGTANFRVLTPYDYFDDLPLVNVSRTPARFSVLATIGLTVLAGLGIAALARRAPGRRFWVVALAGLVVVAEFFTAPFELERPPDMQLARTIGRQVAETDPNGTVLTLPYRRAEQERVFHQVQHERPIFGGFIPRDSEHPFRTSTPGFAELSTAKPFRDIFSRPPDSSGASSAEGRPHIG